MADPLSMLRQYNMSHKSIEVMKLNDEETGVEQTYLCFGDQAFPKNAKTNYVKKYGAGREVSELKEFYTLGCLYFLIQNKKLRHPVYVKNAVASEWQDIVNIADRRDVLAYLNGEIQASDNIDRSAPLEAPVSLKRPRQDHFFSSSAASKRPRFEDEEQAQKERERLETLLDDNALSGSRLGNIRALSDQLTSDKIKSLKQKMMQRKQRQVIKPVEDNEHGMATMERQLVEQEVDVVRDIVSKERQWRNRVTCLEAQSRNFMKSIFPIMSSIKAREEGRSGVTKVKAGPEVSVQGTVAKTQQSRGYNRYEQEELRREETGEFQIDTNQTYHGMALKAITEGAKPKLMEPKLGSISAMPSSSQENRPSSKPSKRTSKTPIIIIPAAATSLISLYNAQDLLQELRFVSTEEKKASGMRRENQLLIHRTKEAGSVVPFQIIDSPLKLTNEDWDRVVAVFVQGPAWQFKGWPWGGTPVDIFSKIAAFHLKFEDQRLDQNVSKWNVNVLTLSQSKRHLDRASMIKFWDVLDRHIIKFKPQLRT